MNLATRFLEAVSRRAPRQAKRRIGFSFPAAERSDEAFLGVLRQWYVSALKEIAHHHARRTHTRAPRSDDRQELVVWISRQSCGAGPRELHHLCRVVVLADDLYEYFSLLDRPAYAAPHPETHAIQNVLALAAAALVAEVAYARQLEFQNSLTSRPWFARLFSRSPAARLWSDAVAAVATTEPSPGTTCFSTSKRR